MGGILLHMMSERRMSSRSANPTSSTTAATEALHQPSRATQRCRCCLQRVSVDQLVPHPLGDALGLPQPCMCILCHKIYTAGRWEWEQNENGKDAYCRICGEGNMGTVSCDNPDCTYSFCEGCILVNCGRRRFRRVLQLADDERWHCFVCTGVAAKQRGAPPVPDHNVMRRHLHLSARAAEGGFTKRTIFNCYQLKRFVPSFTYFDPKRVSEIERSTYGSEMNEEQSMRGRRERKMRKIMAAAQVRPIMATESESSEIDEDEETDRMDGGSSMLHMQVAADAMQPLPHPHPASTVPTSLSSFPSISNGRSPSGWKKLICYSFFLHEFHSAAHHIPYVCGLMENVYRIHRDWPGWTMRLYYDDSFIDHTPDEHAAANPMPDGFQCNKVYRRQLDNAWCGMLFPLLKRMEASGLVELVRFHWPIFQDKDRVHHGTVGCFARFLALAELGKRGRVEHVMMADLDDWLTPEMRRIVESGTKMHQRFHDPRYGGGSIQVWAGGFNVRIPPGVDRDTWVNPYSDIESRIMEWGVRHTRDPLSIHKRPEMFRQDRAERIGQGQDNGDGKEARKRIQAEKERQQRQREEEDQLRMQERQRSLHANAPATTGSGLASHLHGASHADDESKSPSNPPTSASSTTASDACPSPPSSSSSSLIFTPASMMSSIDASSASSSSSQFEQEHKQQRRPCSNVAAEFDDPDNELRASRPRPMLTALVWRDEEKKHEKRESQFPLRDVEEEADEVSSHSNMLTSSTPSLASAMIDANNSGDGDEDDDDCVVIDPPPKSKGEAHSQPQRRNRSLRSSSRSPVNENETRLSSSRKRQSRSTPTELSSASTQLSSKLRSSLPSSTSHSINAADDFDLPVDECEMEFFPYGCDQVLLAEVVWPIMRESVDTVYALLITENLRRESKVWPPKLTAEEQANMATAKSYWAITDWLPLNRRPNPANIEAHIKKTIVRRWGTILAQLPIRSICSPQHAHIMQYIPQSMYKQRIANGELTIPQPFGSRYDNTTPSQSSKSTTRKRSSTDRTTIDLTHAFDDVMQSSHSPTDSALPQHKQQPRQQQPAAKKRKQNPHPDSHSPSSSSSEHPTPTRIMPSRQSKRIGQQLIAAAQHAEENDIFLMTAPDDRVRRRARAQQSLHDQHMAIDVEGLDDSPVIDPNMIDTGIEAVDDSDDELQTPSKSRQNTDEAKQAQKPLISVSPSGRTSPNSSSSVQVSVRLTSRARQLIGSSESKTPKSSQLLSSSSTVSPPSSPNTSNRSSAVKSSKHASGQAAASSSSSSHIHYLDECEWGCRFLHDARVCQSGSSNDERKSCSNHKRLMQDVDASFHTFLLQGVPNPTSSTQSTSDLSMKDTEDETKQSDEKSAESSRGANAISATSTPTIRDRPSRTKRNSSMLDHQRFHIEPQIATAAPTSFSSTLHIKSGGRIVCTCICTFCSPTLFQLPVSKSRPLFHPRFPSVAWPWDQETVCSWLVSLHESFMPLSLMLPEAKLPQLGGKSSGVPCQNIEHLINTPPTQLVKIIHKTNREFQGSSGALPELLAYSLYEKLCRLKDEIVAIAKAQ